MTARVLGGAWLGLFLNVIWLWPLYCPSDIGLAALVCWVLVPSIGLALDSVVGNGEGLILETVKRALRGEGFE